MPRPKAEIKSDQQKLTHRAFIFMLEIILLIAAPGFGAVFIVNSQDMGDVTKIGVMIVAMVVSIGLIAFRMQPILRKTRLLERELSELGEAKGDSTVTTS